MKDALRRAGGRLARESELSDVRADARRVESLAEAVAENRRQQVLLHELLHELEQRLVPVIETALGERR